MLGASALLALTLLSPSGAAQEAVEEPAPAPEAPAAADTDSEAEPEAEPEAPIGPVAAPEPSPAQAYSDLLKEALELELTVQAHEFELLGNEDPETLNEHQIRRLERITTDLTSFRELEGHFSVEPLTKPRPKRSVSLSADEVVVIEQLGEAYDDSRTPRTLQRLNELNQRFLESNDWSRRDAAVRLRDEILAREVAFLTLFSQGFQVAQGEGSPELVEEMTTRLRELSPDTMDTGASLTVLMLDKPELQQSVLGEVMAWAAADSAPVQPPRSANQLIADIQTLQVKVLEDSGLVSTVAEIQTLNEDITSLKEELDANAYATVEDRQQALARLVEMRKRRNELTREWYSADPGETADRLVHTYDRLIRTRMSDMGPKGALFSARFNALDRTRERTEEDPAYVWRLLEEQEVLLAAIDATEPTTSPLRGLAPPPDTDAFRAALQQAKAAVRTKTPIQAPAYKKFSGSKTFHKGKVPGTGAPKKKPAGGKKKKKKKGR